MSLRRGSFLALGLLAWSTSGLVAREPDPQQPPGPQPAFPTQAQIAWIDAAVSDAHERPVAGLGAEDFAVIEDDEPRPILAFRAPEPASAFIVLVEDVLARPQQLPRIRDAVKRLVAGARPGDQVLLAAASGVSASAAPPGDATAFLAQLDRLRADPGRVASLRQAAEIQSLNERRVDAVAGALAALEGHAGSRALVVVGPSLPYEVGGGAGARAHERVLRASQRALAPVYFLSCGEDPLSGPEPGGSGWADASGGVARATPLLPTTRPSAVPAGTRLYEAVAADSGGFSSPLALAWAESVDRIQGRSQARYLLGIASALPEDGRFHPVEVRALRAGVRIHARRGYFAPRAQASPRER